MVNATLEEFRWMFPAQNLGVGTTYQLCPACLIPRLVPLHSILIYLYPPRAELLFACECGASWSEMAFSPHYEEVRW